MRTVNEVTERSSKPHGGFLLPKGCFGTVEETKKDPWDVARRRRRSLELIGRGAAAASTFGPRRRRRARPRRRAEGGGSIARNGSSKKKSRSVRESARDREAEPRARRGRGDAAATRKTICDAPTRRIVEVVNSRGGLVASSY